MAIFGSDAEYEYDYTLGYDDSIVALLASLSQDGIGQSMSLYAKRGAGSNVDVRYLIYDSDKNFVAQTNETTFTAANFSWKTASFSTPPSLTTGSYYLGVHCDGNSLKISRNTSGGGGMLIDSRNGVHYPSYPATLTQDYFLEGWDVSIYCTYELDTGGGGTSSLNLGMGMGTGLQTGGTGGKLPHVCPGPSHRRRIT